MSDDLIDRLKARCVYGDARLLLWKKHDPLSAEAAAEIYRLRAEIERLRAAIDAWRTAFWVMDGHAVAIHDSEGKCYSVRAHDYIVMHDLHRAAPPSRRKD